MSAKYQGLSHLNHGPEISKVQEALVKLNLKIKALNQEFGEIVDQRDMEDLNAQVRGQLKTFREQIQVLESLSAGQSDPNAVHMLNNDVESHRLQMGQCQKQFREANLKCILQMQNRERDQLFRESTAAEGAGGGAHQRKKAKDREALLSDSGQVTDNLAAISRQLADTVQRSSLTVDDLVGSSSTVQETNHEFKSMGAEIGQSRKLITKYGRRETTTHVLIFVAFCFFLAVVFHILRKRVWGPLDPMLLTWNTLTTLITTVMGLVGM